MSRKPNAQMVTWLGIAACLIGFASIGFGWSQVVDATEVEDQVGWLLGLGLGGLGAIVVGVLVIGLAARRTDADAAAAQADELAAVLDRLGAAVEGGRRR